MTPEQHNKYLSWAHFGHAMLTAFWMLVAMGIMIFAMGSDPHPPPPAFVVVMVAFFSIFTALLAIPSLVAAYALRKRKRWTKTMCIAAGVVAAMSAPVGTAVCVYTFWFLFSEPGRILYDNPQRMLPQQRDIPWNVNRSTEKEAAYVPPSSPPDWR